MQMWKKFCPGILPSGRPPSSFLLPPSFLLLPSSFFLLPSSSFLLPHSSFLLPPSSFLLPVGLPFKTVTHFDNFLLRDYVNKFKGPTNASFEDLISDQSYFREKFTQFLFSPKGGIFQVTRGKSFKLQLDKSSFRPHCIGVKIVRSISYLFSPSQNLFVLF